MPKWTTRQKLIAIANYKTKDYRQIGDMIGKSPNQIHSFLARNNFKKIPDYSEMEDYMLLNFPAKLCAQFIPKKTLNALKIKQCRLRKNIRAN
jgi:hypothetical protein